MAPGWSCMGDFGKCIVRGSIMDHGQHVYQIWKQQDKGRSLGRTNKKHVLNLWDFEEEEEEEEEDQNCNRIGTMCMH